MWLRCFMGSLLLGPGDPIACGPHLGQAGSRQGCPLFRAWVPLLRRGAQAISTQRPPSPADHTISTASPGALDIPAANCTGRCRNSAVFPQVVPSAPTPQRRARSEQAEAFPTGAAPWRLVRSAAGVPGPDLFQISVAHRSWRPSWGAPQDHQRGGRSRNKLTPDGVST